MSSPIPFAERYSPWRGILDLACGAYPAFLFGLPVGAKQLPVFHFHEVTWQGLEPYFQYLSENGYRSLMAEELAAHQRGEQKAEARSVVLCFDDAWSSFYQVGLPLLQKYGLRAITYVAPGRVLDAESCRPLAEGADTVLDDEGSPWATWPEIQAMQASGWVDVQGHSYSHSMISVGTELQELVTAQSHFARLSWPLIEEGRPPRHLSADDLGYPLAWRRSRLSDATRFLPDPDYVQRCQEWAKAQPADWSTEELQSALGPIQGREETQEEREAAWELELRESREMLEQKLGKSVKHICMPWAVCGREAEARVKSAGYESMVADAVGGQRCSCYRGNPYRIMRLKHELIYALPGKERRLWPAQVLLKKRPASAGPSGDVP